MEFVLNMELSERFATTEGVLIRPRVREFVTGTVHQEKCALMKDVIL